MAHGLTIPQICGQLIIAGYEEATPPPSLLDLLRRGLRGGAILFKRNIPSVEAAYQACRQLHGAALPGFPTFICVDQEGGRVRRIPAPLLQLPAMAQLSSTGDDNLVERAARVIGRQLRALGFNLNLAPVLDVHTNPANPVIGDRAFSTNPVDAARLAVAFMRGLHRGGIAACGKHFPGHGDTSVDSHLALPSVDVDLAQLRTREFIPFRSAIQAGIECIMSAHVICERIAPGRPATLSPDLLQQVLRGELGFDGVVLSDDMEMGAIAAQGSVANAAVIAIRSGCDALLICRRADLQEQAHEALVHEAERDSAFAATCEQSMNRCLRTRRQKPPRPASTLAEALATLDTPETLAIERELKHPSSHHHAG